MKFYAEDEISQSCHMFRRQLTCGIVQNGHDVDVDVSSPVKRLIQHVHDVITDAPRGLEGLGPRLEDADVQRFLDHGETESEPCRREKRQLKRDWCH